MTFSNHVTAHFAGEDLHGIVASHDELLTKLTEILSNAAQLASVFGTDKAVSGLWRLFDPSHSDSMHILAQNDLNPAERAKVIFGIEHLYKAFFANVCTPTLTHTQTKLGAMDANILCYMLWDIAPLHPAALNNADLDRICIDVLINISRLSHIACKEAAIHGLRGWAVQYPEQVNNALDHIITQEELHPDLVTFAKGMKTNP